MDEFKGLSNTHFVLLFISLFQWMQVIYSIGVSTDHFLNMDFIEPNTFQRNKKLNIDGPNNLF